LPYSFVDHPAKDHERQRDPALAETLKAEGPGILAWLVAGYHSWLEKGLAPPASIQAETDGYRHVDDSIHQFISEKCLLGPDNWVRAQGLFDAYSEFCEETGFKPKGKRTFFTRLQSEFIKGKAKNGMYYKGLCLNVSKD